MTWNLFLLAKKEFASLSMKIVEEEEEIFIVRRRARFDGKKGDIVSLLPVGLNANGVTTKGLLYSLRGETLVAGSTRSLRNRITRKHVEISVRRGILLVVHRFA